MTDNTVAITGMGLVSSLGLDVDANWTRLQARETGIHETPRGAAPASYRYRGRIRGFEPPGDIPRPLMSQLRFLNRGSLLGLAAAREAMTAAHAADLPYAPRRRALYIGASDTTSVGYPYMYPATREATDGRWQGVDRARLNQAALDKVNPFFLLESLNNNLFSFLSAYLGFVGPNTSMATHSPCGSNAVELAYRSIRQGRADVAMAVGCGNWLEDISIYEMRGLGLLSRCRQGAASYRPLSRSRDGFIPGAGGGALLLENAAAARQRGAVIHGVVAGVGNTLEVTSATGFGITAEGCRAALGSALREAGRECRDLGMILAHGSATRKGDGAELAAFQTLLGEDAGRVPVTALKPYTGHMGSTSDVAEIILGVRAMQESLVPATLNFDRADSEFARLRISDRHQESARSRFVSMSNGIGGQSSALVIEV